MIIVRTWFNKKPQPGTVSLDQKLFATRFKKNNEPRFDPLQTPEELGFNFDVTAIVKNHNDQKYDASIFFLEANLGDDYLWQDLKFRDDCAYLFFCATDNVYEKNFLLNTINIFFCETPHK